MWISKNRRFGDTAGRLGAALYQSGDEAGGSAEGHPNYTFLPPDPDLMTMSQLTDASGRQFSAIFKEPSHGRRPASITVSSIPKKIGYQNYTVNITEHLFSRFIRIIDVLRCIH